MIVCSVFTLSAYKFAIYMWLSPAYFLSLLSRIVCFI